MEFTGAPVDAPPGDAPTRARVVASIGERGPSTAAQLAEQLSLTPAAVRRHLDHLVQAGVLEEQERRTHGPRGRGRPARQFRLTDAGHGQLDQQYDDLATEALRFLAETGGEEAVAAFARRRVAFIGRDYALVTAQDPTLSPPEALAEVLSRGGYAASVQDSPVGEQLCQQHCPVAHVAEEFPQLCEAETAAIGQVLGRHVQRLATIAHGDGVCTTCIPDLPGADLPGADRGHTRPHVPHPGTRTPPENRTTHENQTPPENQTPHEKESVRR